MRCERCGIDYEGSYCPACYNVSYQKKKRRIPSAVIILLLIFFFPLGIILMWCNCSWKNVAKIIITVFFGLLTLIVVAFSEETPSSYKLSDSPSRVSRSQETFGDNDSVSHTPEQITYMVVDLQTMFDELDSNAMKAETKYQKKYIEFECEISSFDSDGEYISVEPVGASAWNFSSALCYIKNEKQRSFLIEKNVGDTITIRGRVKSIGEILGYTIDINDVY